LPRPSLDYIKRIEELVGVSVTIVGVGPQRDQTLIRDAPAQPMDAALAN